MNDTELLVATQVLWEEKLRDRTVDTPETNKLVLDLSKKIVGYLVSAVYTQRELGNSFLACASAFWDLVLTYEGELEANPVLNGVEPPDLLSNAINARRLFSAVVQGGIERAPELAACMVNVAMHKDEHERFVKPCIIEIAYLIRQWQLFHEQFPFSHVNIVISFNSAVDDGDAHEIIPYTKQEGKVTPNIETRVRGMLRQLTVALVTSIGFQEAGIKSALEAVEQLIGESKSGPPPGPGYPHRHGYLLHVMNMARAVKDIDDSKIDEEWFHLRLAMTGTLCEELASGILERGGGDSIMLRLSEVTGTLVVIKRSLEKIQAHGDLLYKTEKTFFDALPANKNRVSSVRTTIIIGFINGVGRTNTKRIMEVRMLVMALIREIAWFATECGDRKAAKEVASSNCVSMACFTKELQERFGHRMHEEGDKIREFEERALSVRAYVDAKEKAALSLLHDDILDMRAWAARAASFDDLINFFILSRAIFYEFARSVEIL
jgi:hypothetical protein